MEFMSLTAQEIFLHRRREISRKHYWANREKEAKRKSEWRKRKRQHDPKWQEYEPEKLRRWRRKHHETKWGEWSYRRRLLKKEAWRRARAKNRDFDEVAVMAVLENLADACPCCGKPFNLLAKERDRSPSIDRCDSQKGYVADNMEVICFRCNTLKRDATSGELRTVAGWLERRCRSR